MEHISSFGTLPWGEPFTDLISAEHWSNYYSPGNAVYLAIISRSHGTDIGVRVEDSHDFAHRRLDTFIAAESIWYQGLGYTAYEQDLREAYEGYEFPSDINSPLLDPSTSTCCLILNANRFFFELAVTYEKIDGGCGLLLRNREGLVTHADETLAFWPVLCRELLYAIERAQHGYYDDFNVYGDGLAELISPPQIGQDSYLSDKYDSGEGPFNIMYGTYGQGSSFDAWVECDTHSFSVDETGVLTVTELQ